MTTAPRWGTGTVVAFGFAALLLGIALGRSAGRADPALLARIDTVLVHGAAVRDTIGRLEASSRAHADTSARAGRRAVALDPVVVALGRTVDSLAALAHDTAAAFVACRAQVETMAQRSTLDREATQQCGKALAASDTALTVASAYIFEADSALYDARDALALARERPRWAAVAYWGTQSPTPVGAGLSRDLGPFTLSAVYRWDRGEVLGGVGLRF